MSGDCEILAEDNIKVVCRVRPLTENEERVGSKFVVKFPSESDHCCLSIGGKMYQFDNVFKPDAPQCKVYSEAVRPIVYDVLAGYNGTIFAYGQTSSGKTHTMEGVLNDPIGCGMIPRIVDDIFNHIYGLEANVQFQIKVSYYEIYMDKIRDLLDVTKVNLGVYEDRNRIPYVKGVTERFVSSPKEAFQVIEQGKRNRHVAVTNMNEHSSRSHSVILIDVKQDDLENRKQLSGKLYLVDLAGSEKVSKTGAEGAVLDEAKNINKSLSALGNVISALASGSRSHIPYRDSKLTRILQESLGGNARTTVIICCSPASFNATETKSTLEFGRRAKTIKNIPSVNEELTAEALKERYEREREKNRQLKLVVQGLESELTKWRSGETVATEDQLKSESYLANRSTTSLETLFRGQLRSLTPGTPKKRTSDEHQDIFVSQTRSQAEVAQHKKCIVELQKQFAEQEELVSRTTQKWESLQVEATRVQQEKETLQEEMNSFLESFEQLGICYDQKTNECDALGREMEIARMEMFQLQTKLREERNEVEHLKKSSSQQSQHITKLVSRLFQDFTEIAVLLGSKTDDSLDVDLAIQNDAIEGQLAVALLHTTKIKSNVKNLFDRCTNLERRRVDSESTLEECKHKLQYYELQVALQKNQIQSLQTLLGEAEVGSRAAEERIRSLEDQCGKLQFTIGKTELNNRNELIDRLCKTHNQQESRLRDEVVEKQRIINELKSNNQWLALMLQNAETECLKLKRDCKVKSAKLSELTVVCEQREQAQQELVTLEGNIARELQSLQALRKLFIHDLQIRLKKSKKDSDPKASSNGGDSVLLQHQQKRIFVLESNFEQLSKMYKQLVRDNADLRSELPKLEVKLRRTMERIKVLEQALNETRASSLRDRKRYHYEVDRAKENIRPKTTHSFCQLSCSVSARAQIVKPIVAGQRTSPRKSR